MSRRQAVLELLKKYRDTNTNNGWVVSNMITDPDCGGSEGLRRLRELRKAGHPIEKKRMGQTLHFLYRLRPDSIESDQQEMFE